MWYTGHDGATARIGRATSVGPYNWSRSPGSPEFVLGPSGAWDDATVESAYVLNDGANSFLYYAGSDGANERIGRARLGAGYVASGWFESAVLDTGSGGSVWRTLDSTAEVNPSGAITLRTRSGESPTPDASWSTWAGAMSTGSSPITSPRARYLQVRVEMMTSLASYTPTLRDFTVLYDLNGVAAPTPVSPRDGDWVVSPSPPLTWTFGDPEADLQAG